MKITKEWLQEKGACSEGSAWFLAQKETNLIKVARKLVNQDRLDWANWVITRAMTHKQKVAYAIFAAKQVLALFEAWYPNDMRPRNAIMAAEHFLKTGETAGLRDAAYAAAYAAYAAANAADAAYAANAAYAPREMKTKIVVYGIKLLRARTHV